MRNNKLFIFLLSFTILMNYVLIQLPLFKEFSYEYSIINAFFFFITIPFLVFHLKKNNKSSIIIIAQVTSLIFIPLLVVLINIFFQEICSFIDGLIFYFVIAVVSGLLSYFLSEILIYVNIKMRYILLLISLILLLSIPLIELYLNPQIYFYSPLIGFFPGSIYDEDISVDSKLVFYRMLNVIVFFSLYWIAKRNFVRNKVIFSSFILLLIIFSFFISPYLGFSTNENRLKSILPQKFEANHFTIYSDNLDSLEQKVFNLHLEYYLSELQKSTKVKPSKKITVFLFTNDEDKKKYFGSGNADVAKPWLYQIYLNKNTWKSTLKHELAHIISAEFGASILRLAGDLNPFLIEGFATSQEPFLDIYPIDYLASLHYINHNQDIISGLRKSYNFFRFNSTLSYIYAGSFSKYLIDNYGIEKYRLYYSTNEFEKIYKMDFSKVLREYKNYLISYNQNTNPNEHIYSYYFGRKALIQKDCPRFIEKKIKEGWEYFNKGDVSNAKKTFNNILTHSENYSALFGKIECLIKQDSLLDASKLIKDYISKFSSTPYEYLLKFRLADIYTQLNKNENAYEIYSQLENQEPNLNLKFLSNFRIKLLQNGKLNEYLKSNDSLKLEILKELNKENYVYTSIPAFLILARNLKISYEQVLSFFNKTFIQFDEYSFLAFLRLSDYMVDNYDFLRARKIAALAKRANKDELFKSYLNDNYKMLDWFYIKSIKF